MMRIGIVVAAACLALSGCGSSEDTASVCAGVDQAQQSLESLTTTTPETVGDAKQRLTDIQANIEEATADAPVGQKAVLTGISQALDGVQQSLATAKDNAQVPEAVNQAIATVNSTLATASTTLGC